MLAAAYGHNEIVRVLLDRDADPSQTNHAGLTALDPALLGANDIDRFTLMTCQRETVALIEQHALGMKPRGTFFDRTLLFLKPCRY